MYIYNDFQEKFYIVPTDKAPIIMPSVVKKF